MAKLNLDYYDHIIQISRDRFKAGDIAQIDLDRIELLRVQYESEIQNAIVNLRTAKIQLLQLLNDRTPVDQFDVNGPFDFSEDLSPLDDFRKIALDERPDLRAALQTLQQADTNHKLAEANGSTDPTFGAWYTHNSSNNNPNGIQTLGLSVTIPLRIFDKNQGEKKRTQIDIDKSQQLTESARAQVFSDVDSSYELVRGNIALLKPYKAQYQRAGSSRARHSDVFLRTRWRVADGFSQRTKRLSHRSTRLCPTDRLLSDCCRTTESCRRTRGNPMTRTSFFLTTVCLAALVSLSACKKEFNPADGAPPSPKVVATGDMSLVTVDKPDQFPLVAAEKQEAASQLTTTGSVFPDINREVPVISMANGRVVDIKTRLR